MHVGDLCERLAVLLARHEAEDEEQDETRNRRADDHHEGTHLARFPWQPLGGRRVREREG
ncbi:hypothetical protein SDC9_210161 [bioreactor metagenome]|uniref:Uncharacterized protein n=1 Tax=bioreactor metagenome TaxID=1076179 RepID=A0A645JST3_9ZZZZ